VDIRDQLSDPTGVLRRWFIKRTAYMLLCGVLASLASWACVHFKLGFGWEFANGLLAGIAVILTIQTGFNMGRRTSTAMLDRISVRVEEVVATPAGIPQIELLTWPPHDRVVRSVIALATQRADTYTACMAELASYRRLANESPGQEIYFGPGGAVQWMNTSGKTQFAGLGETFATIHELIECWVYPKDRSMLREHADKAMQGLMRDHVEARFLHSGNAFFWGLCRFMPRRDENGEILGVRFSVQDIQSRKEAETRLIEMVAALQRAQALKEHYLGRSNDERMRLSALLDIVKFGILFVDRDRRVTYINQAAAQMWGLESREQVSGMRDAAVLDLSAGLRVDDPAYREHIAEVALRNRRSDPYDVMFRDGRVIREQSAPVPSSDGHHNIGRVWVFEDVTEALHTQQRLTELAECDPLTGLLNRRRFHDELERQFADSMRRGTRMGLISFDFDSFKDINDQYGHQAGDEVLTTMAREIRAVIRRNELLFRLGGDEFAILVPHARRDSVQRLAQRIVEKAASVEFSFAGQPLYVTLSMGIAFAPDHASDTEGLAHAADRALYRAKAEGKNRWHAADEHSWNPVDTHVSTLPPSTTPGE